jgi:glycosyltransferase involved in cell wall biosynthesis
MMRLALVYDYPLRAAGGRLWTHRSYGTYVDALAPHYARLLLVAPLAPSEQTLQLQHCLRAPNAELMPLPYYTRWVSSAPATAALAGLLLRRRAAWDALYVRIPCPLALPAFAVATLLRRPLLLHVVGDLLAQMSTYAAPLQPIARTAGLAMEGATRAMAGHALTITQGSVLAARYSRPGRPAHSIIESTASEEDLWVRRAVRPHAPARILCVAALLEKKGLQHLVDAVGALQARARLTLTLAGAGPFEQRLRALVRQHNLTECVRFTGALGSEEALRAEYRAADLFVLPSLAEGVPRVLLEAMAQSLPVISTRVGGVGDIVDDGTNGLLVEPASPTALVDAMWRLLTDDALRQRLITNGPMTARRYSREAHARSLTRLLTAYVHHRYPLLTPLAAGAHQPLDPTASAPGGSPPC